VVQQEQELVWLVEVSIRADHDRVAALELAEERRAELRRVLLHLYFGLDPGALETLLDHLDPLDEGLPVARRRDQV
jgi:hypothetical protein